MLKLTRSLERGNSCPRFYALYAEDIFTQRYKVAIIPLNVFMALGIHGWRFLCHAWRSICFNRYDAFQQGVDHGMRDALKAMSLHKKGDQSSPGDQKAGMDRLRSLIIALIVMAACLPIVACVPVQPDSQPPVPYFFGDNVDIYIDMETGCEYLIFDGPQQGGITPRMRPDGTQICREHNHG